MIGTSLSHYRIAEKLGQGGMGEVYRAEDTSLSRQVAIKVLPDEFAHDAERLARFEREAKLFASLNRPDIAAIHGQEEYEGRRFLVLELVEGQTLAERFFRKLLKGRENRPRHLVSDRLRNHGAAHRTIMLSVIHDSERHANNRAGASRQPARQRERQMRGFKTVAQTRRSLSVNGIIQYLFHVGRHQLRAANHRVLRARSFLVWHVVTCA